MTVPAILVTALLSGAAIQDPPALPARIMAEISASSVRRAVDALAGFGTRHSGADTRSRTRGVGAARKWLQAWLERAAETSNGRMDVDTRRFEASVGRRTSRTLKMMNVFATLRGHGPGADRVIVVLGHYDSRASGAMDVEADAPGADDNASGTAVALELARVLADEELESTVVFLCTDGEELGLFGAKDWVARAVAEGLDIRAALNCDIVGDPTGPNGERARETIRLFSEGVPATADEDALRGLRRLASASDSPSRQLARFVADVARRHDTTVKPHLVFRTDRFLRGGDHSAFNEQGIAAVRFTEFHEHYARQHQDVRVEDGVRYGDLPEFVDAEYLADVCRLNAAALLHLANGPSVPADARIVTARLTNDTTLRWTPSPEDDVVGYEVVWRDTTAADWEHVEDVGDVVEATIPRSKDDVFFGVRAVDVDGYRSVVAFPRASRR